MLSDGAAGGGIRAAGIDLNCDMGEGMETDAAIFPFVSSANIACGGHAGDADTMRRTVELALRHGVAIGAHPSYPDRGNFGRVDVLGVSLQPGELRSILQEQLDRLQGVCREFGTRMRHVKPHGALYNRAARDTAVAMLIVRAVAGFDDSLLLYGLSGGVMKDVADVAGIRFVSEVFADRTYQRDGTLTPRSQPGALIGDGGSAVAQVLKMVREGSVFAGGAGPAGSGSGALRADAGGEAGKPQEVAIAAETICLHGDGVHAVEFARLVHDALTAEGIRVEAPWR